MAEQRLLRQNGLHELLTSHEICTTIAVGDAERARLSLEIESKKP
jgi:hypothetical protein